MTRQQEIMEWAVETFGPIAEDRNERALRLFEEVVELMQCEGVSRFTLLSLIEHVYDKPVGMISKEIGQVGLTLECLAENLGFNVDVRTQVELDRLKSLPSEHFRARQNAKAELGIAGKCEVPE